MVGGIVEVQRLRRRLRVVQSLEDQALRARLEKSCRDSERTIEEWNNFVRGRNRALRPRMLLVPVA